MKPRIAILSGLAFAALVGALWGFPYFWYSKQAAPGELVWLGETTNVAGWRFEMIPISGLAESMLMTDQSLNGKFWSSSGERMIRVFSARRFEGDRDQESLLRHTPDACWSGAGWKMLPAEPQCLTCSVHGLAISFERRLFQAGGQKELVYFGALMGGRALPFRPNHYQGGGARRSHGQSGLALWLREKRYWGMTWDAFRNRTPFGGPQQFIRISTPVQGNDLATADERLKSFLPQWLQRVDYQKEYAEWSRAKPGREREGK